MHVLKEMNTEREPEFVRDAEGAKLARMGVNTFRKLAEEFDAVYKIGKNTLRLKHPHTIMLTSIHQWGCTIQEIRSS